jgi:branched-chain amino acid aminotransferase
LNIVLGKLEAWDSGFDEAVMLDDNGFVCECPGFNISGVRGNTLFTPSHGILVGITRNSVMAMARDFGMEVKEGFFTVFDFTSADEVFMTNTVAGVAPVANIDGWTIGDGKMGPRTRKFQELYVNWLETGQRGTQVFPEAWS